jgi:hypothetical protein
MEGVEWPVGSQIPREVEGELGWTTQGLVERSDCAEGQTPQQNTNITRLESWAYRMCDDKVHHGEYKAENTYLRVVSTIMTNCGDDKEEGEEQQRGRR